jgi:hypothetical protein
MCLCKSEQRIALVLTRMPFIVMLMFPLFNGCKRNQSSQKYYFAPRALPSTPFMYVPSQLHVDSVVDRLHCYLKVFLPTFFFFYRSPTHSVQSIRAHLPANQLTEAFLYLKEHPSHVNVTRKLFFGSHGKRKLLPKFPDTLALISAVPRGKFCTFFMQQKIGHCVYQKI